MSQRVEENTKEDPQERTAREMIELLQELRIVIPGVQVLFAFLLTVPFNQRFTELNTVQRDVFFSTLLFTAAAVEGHREQEGEEHLYGASDSALGPPPAPVP